MSKVTLAALACAFACATASAAPELRVLVGDAVSTFARGIRNRCSISVR